MVGHSIVFWAGQYTAASGWGSDLGLECFLHLDWAGLQGMQWSALLSIVTSWVQQDGIPRAVVIQLGQSDLPEWKRVALSQDIITDLRTLHHQLPGTMLIWSTLLENCAWHGALCPDQVDNVRWKVCKAAAQIVSALGGLVISHLDITFWQLALYQGDRVHLSEQGADIWLHGIMDMLLQWVQAGEWWWEWGIKEPPLFGG